MEDFKKFESEMETSFIKKDDDTALMVPESEEKKEILSTEPELLEGDMEIVVENKKKGLKIFAIVALTIMVILLGTYLTINWIIPSVKLHSANKLFESGEFLLSAEQFEALGDFKDAQDKANAAYYAYGNELYENGKYSEAAKQFLALKSYEDARERALAAYYAEGQTFIDSKDYSKAADSFSKAGAYEDAKGYLSYAKGMVALNSRKYTDAISAFKNAEGIEDSEERYKEASYKYAEQFFTDKDYESAKRYYKDIKDFEDAETKYVACDLMLAEEDYQNGWLNGAKEKFKKLPKNFKFSNISVSERLSALNKHSDFLKICGVWTNVGGSGKAKVRETSKRFGSWEEWSTDFSGTKTSITISARIKSNGKVNVTGLGGFYAHTKYSSLSSLLEPKLQTVLFSKDISSIYDTIKVDEYTTLRFDGKKFILNYSKTNSNESMYFNYIYTSTFTYPKREKKY